MGTAKEAAIEQLNADLRDGRIKVAHERAPRRSHTLRKHLPMFEPRGGLPAGGRDECKNGERPCPYVRCKWHLWMLLGTDRPGRRYAGGAVEHPPTTLEPRWLEWPTPACCALDIADAVRTRGLSPAFIAQAMGRSYASVWRIVRDAIEKLRANGVELEEFKP